MHLLSITHTPSAAIRGSSLIVKEISLQNLLWSSKSSQLSKPNFYDHLHITITILHFSPNNSSPTLGTSYSYHEHFKVLKWFMHSATTNWPIMENKSKLISSPCHLRGQMSCYSTHLMMSNLWKTKLNLRPLNSPLPPHVFVQIAFSSQGLPNVLCISQLGRGQRVVYKALYQPAPWPGLTRQ